MKETNDIVNKILEKIQDDFNFLQLETKDILEVIKIKLNLITIDNKTNYELELIESVYNHYCEVAGLNIKQDHSIIDKIIKSTVTKNNNFKLKNIDDIIAFLNTLNVDLDIQIYKTIIENIEVDKVLKEIITDDCIDQTLLLSLTNNLDTLKLLEVYCELNKIDIIENYQKNLNLQDESMMVELSCYERYIKDIVNIPLLTKEEVFELGKKIKNDNDLDAKKKLFESNLRLVIPVANACYIKGVPVEDLIQEGNIGLMTAVDNYDVDRGCMFSTYAMWWIKQSVNRAAKKYSRIIKIPDYQYDELIKYNYKKRQLFSDNKGDFTYEEISQLLNISVNEVIKFEKMLIDVSSLNICINDENDSQLIEFIRDESLNNIDDIMQNNEIKSVLNDVMNQLTEKQRMVLQLRFGFNDDIPKTLQETADILYDTGLINKRITRERVRQIQQQAITKIKKNKSYKKLQKLI